MTLYADTLSPAEAAERIGVDRTTVIRWINSGGLRAAKTPGGHWRIFRESIDELLAEHKAS